MCGIAGFIEYKNQVGRDTLINITDKINYRGPDDSGYEFYTKRSFQIGLGHRRLSIIDLSAAAHQPMHHLSWSIVFNGEIYNYREIQAELKEKGLQFTSSSDTEVILKAIEYWGISETLNKLNGMFAFALFNHDTEELILARDRIGVKPLYYFYYQDSFVFASELKPIMAYPFFQKRINFKALHLFLCHGYITSPYSIFENTYKVEPGTYLSFKDKKIVVHTYWSIEEKFSSRVVDESITESKAIEKLDELITSSVKYRMISDVPIGAFLSGGYDSSIVAAIMQSNSEKPINTFTIGFNEKEYDEAHHAKTIATHLKTNHQELYLPINNAKELIESIPHFYDEPFADSSQIPTMLVSQLARKQVTVALSGDGGDEIFCGYTRYALASNYKKYMPISKIMNFVTSILPFTKDILKSDRRLLKLLYLNNHPNIINHDYLYSTIYLKKLVKNHTYSVENKYFEILSKSSNVQEAYMLQDMITYLPDDILTKVDRATMSVSLEGRDPLLDYRIFEYSFTLPHHLKFRNGQKKYILKQLAHQYIPEKLLNRPKMGFGIPIYKWLKSDLSYLIEEYLSEQVIKEQDIFDYDQLAKLLALLKKDDPSEYFSRIIWHLIVFQMWAKQYL
ncbi:MAG: asparagine synthase (glutamine-hydrolyzing) [Cytophagales bacterium]|nr:MAG: asparagine synthase (glutamine-hydrolyzing) [Cytophagales bacterium]